MFVEFLILGVVGVTIIGGIIYKDKILSCLTKRYYNNPFQTPVKKVINNYQPIPQNVKEKIPINNNKLSNSYMENSISDEENIIINKENSISNEENIIINKENSISDEENTISNKENSISDREYSMSNEENQIYKSIKGNIWEIINP